MTIPTLQTDRLLLRGFSTDDAPRVKLLAGDFEIADTTLTIPHPYEDGMAEEWISTHASDIAEKRAVNFAICLKEDNLLIGAISLTKIDTVHQKAEVGYWVGKAYWNCGYCTEAAAKVLEFGFKSLNLHRIYAHHLSRNPASGKVMLKIGMQHEGTMREAIIKWKKFENIEAYGILKSDFARLDYQSNITK